MIVVVASVTRWRYIIFQYLPFETTKNVPNSIEMFPKEVQSFCQILSQLANNCRKLLKCCHFGENSTNLVTRIVAVSVTYPPTAVPE